MIAVPTLARSLVIAFWLATAAYAFLASVPFVYEQFLQPGLVPALVAFARWHGWAAPAIAVVAGVAVWPDIANRRAPVASGALVWLLSLAGVAAAVYGPLAAAEPGPGATALGLGSLVPVAWLAMTDLRLAPWTDAPRTTDATARDAVVMVAAAMLLAVGYALMGVVAGSASLLGGLQSLAAHLLLFAAVFACFACVRAVADLTAKPAQWEGLCAVILLAGMVAVALSSVMLSAVSARDWGSRSLVAAFGASVALVVAARGLRTGRPDERDGVVLVMSGFLPPWARAPRPLPRVAWALLVVAIAVGLRAASGAMDWNFVVAKLGAMAVWFLVLATITVWAPERVYLPSALPFGVCAAVLAGHMAVTGRLPLTPVPVEAAEASADAWAVGDPSYRVLRDWLHRPIWTAPAAVASASAPGMRFFDYVQAHTNISRSVPVEPVPVQLAPLAGPPSARRPHIFVFVVDSLRRDYLSPYNPAVTFTPAIAKFATESTVFTRPFTRYGATGLSVPSIWVGGMVLHKQYVTPFAPMNTLHALLAHDGYRRWISMDNILEVIMPRDSSLDEVDRGRGVGDFRFCSTIDELRGRLDRIAADHQPTFVWSLPQDIHVAALTREGNASVDDRDYAGFFAPYASRVRRFDACFGGFVDDLKARGLYDDSVIVLTSDHGDSLGEEGRWGHAYTLFPEVVQVPLLVHLPADLRERSAWNADAPVFTTDITPTLYALLGFAPSPPSAIFGVPLMWPKGAPPPERPAFGLMASSYGSVYGWIDPPGRQMYIADGVALRDYVYDLDGSATGRARPVSDGARAAGQVAIRRGIAAIGDFYRFTPPTR